MAKLNGSHQPASSIDEAELAAWMREAESAMQRGQLQEAANFCKRAIEAQENYAPPYALMSELMRRSGNQESALKFIELAIRFAENPVRYFLARGQALYVLKRFDEAEADLREYLDAEPNQPQARLLYAATLAYIGRRAEAHQQFDRVRELAPALQDIADEQEALVCKLSGDKKAAEQIFERMLARKPDHPAALCGLGLLRIEQRRDAEAKTLLEKSLTADATQFDAWVGLSALAEREKDLEKAAKYAAKAVDIRPSALSARMRFGLALRDSDKLPLAEEQFRIILKHEPNNLLAHSMMLNLLFRQHRKTEALANIDALIAKHPNGDHYVHLRNAVLGETSARAPDSYVRGLFDEYAEKFEEHLRTTLQYRSPEILRDMITQTMNERGVELPCRLLDLGCGSGLMAEMLQDQTSERVGLDLAPKMVERASRKQDKHGQPLYQHLEAIEIHEFLQRDSDRFDIIVAADVLVYVGDLDEFVRLSAARLAENGMLAFTIESDDTVENYVLRETARYAHSDAYVKRMAAKHGWQVVAMRSDMIRSESQQPIHGHYYVLCRA